MSYDRHTTWNKSLFRDFYRIRLNENDLLRLSNLVETFADSIGTQCLLTIKTGDGEDTIETNDKNFLMTSSMPNNIQSISIKTTDKLFTPSLSIELRSVSKKSWYDTGRAELSVSGSDTNLVSGIYREIVRELEAHQIWDKNILRFLKSYLGTLLVGFISACAIYSIFDFIIRLIARIDSNFWDSNTRSTLATIGWIAVPIMFVLGGILIVNTLEHSFPTVEFSGRLTDPSHIFRNRLKWIVSCVVIPIILNLIASFLFERMR